MPPPSPEARIMRRDSLDGPAGDGRRLVRRLDWRFLLPDPRLRRVVYVGTRDDALMCALGLFSESLQRFPDCGSGAMADLIVARAASRADLEDAITVLAPHGSLYWELPRLRNPLRSAAAWLTSRGFTNVSMHWHWPGFDECRQIVSLSERSAVAALLRDHFAGVDHTLSMALSRPLVAPRGLWRLLPAISIAAARRGAGTMP